MSAPVNGLTLLTTLYYRTNIPSNPTKSNAVRINLFNNLNVDPSSSTIAGVSNRFMMNANGVRNNDIITFVNYRTPEVNSLEEYSIYALLYETLTIQTSTGLISASATYADTGSDPNTQVPYVQYAVSAASGPFVSAKIVTIYFDNINKTRRVEIYA
jgi:hypothetical protein